MKFFAKIILVLILIPSIIIVLFSATIKFQLFDPNFWKDDFKNNNVYFNLSNDLKTYTEDQNIKGGAKTGDLKVITDVITPTILEDFISHNIDNSLAFINGGKKELLVYLPVGKIPKELAPKSVGLNTEEIPLAALMTKFNVDANTIPISQIAYFGTFVNYLLVGSAILTAMFLIFLFLLTENGDRFISIGLSFVLSGFVILSSSKIFNSVQITNKIAADILPSVLMQISKTWSLIGVITLVVGIIFLFLKKPSFKKPNKL